MMSFFLMPFLFMMIAMSTISASQWNKPTPAAPTNYSALPTPSATPAAAAEPPSKVFFAIFGTAFGAIILANVTLAPLTIYAGRCIQQRKLFTILVLSSPAGEAEFKRVSDQSSD